MNFKNFVIQNKEVAKDTSLSLPFSGSMQDYSKNIWKWTILLWGYCNDEDRTGFCLEQTETLLLSTLERGKIKVYKIMKETKSMDMASWKSERRDREPEKEMYSY